MNYMHVGGVHDGELLERSDGVRVEDGYRRFDYQIGDEGVTVWAPEGSTTVWVLRALVEGYVAYGESPDFDYLLRDDEEGDPAI